jgi:hypothetical protein
MLGGHGGVGWRKFDRIAAGLQAGIIILSATPQYNDADRVYCVQHVLDPNSVRGGYLGFLSNHCTTEINPFAQTPYVTGFQNYSSAEAYLADLPYVFHVPENVHIPIRDVHIVVTKNTDFEKYGLVPNKDRICASQIEARHAEYLWAYHENNSDQLNRDIIGTVMALYNTQSTIVFSASKTIAQTMAFTLNEVGIDSVLIDGDTKKMDRLTALQRFKQGNVDILICTAAIATGTDGLDQVCDHLIILKDTDDDALRQQLIGRIKPRGDRTDISNKRVTRINVVPE